MLDNERLIKLQEEVSILQADNYRLKWHNTFLRDALVAQKRIHSQLGTTLFIASIDTTLAMCDSNDDKFLKERIK